MYISDQLITDLEHEKLFTELKLCDRKKIQKIIRGYFIIIHNEAVESTVMATNKSQYVKPEFYDK